MLAFDPMLVLLPHVTSIALTRYCNGRTCDGRHIQESRSGLSFCVELQEWRGPCLLGQVAHTRKRFSQSHWPLERFSYWPTLFRRDAPSQVNEALLAQRQDSSAHARRDLSGETEAHEQR